MKNTDKEENSNKEEKKSAAGANDEHPDALLRLQADFDNFKKRIEKDKQEFIKFANENLISELLHIVDDLERTLSAADKAHDPKVLHQGVEMILAQLKQVLTKKGLTEIKSVGEQFNPQVHEAVDFIIADDKPDGEIIEELQKGYKLNDRVIRVAKVRVVKNSPQSADHSPQ